MKGCNTFRSRPSEPCLPVPMHVWYTPAFRNMWWHSPHRAAYPANSSYRTEQLTAHSPLPSVPILSRRLHSASINIKLHVWPTDMTALVRMYLCSYIFYFMLACPSLFFLKADVDKMPDLKGKQNKFNLKKTFIWSYFKPHSLTDIRQLSPLLISSLHQRSHTLSHGQWDFPIKIPFGQTSVQADELTFLTDRFFIKSV